MIPQRPVDKNFPKRKLYKVEVVYAEAEANCIYYTPPFTRVYPDLDNKPECPSCKTKDWEFMKDDGTVVCPCGTHWNARDRMQE